MNTRGELVLRDVVFMMIMVSAIFVLAGLFVGEMSVNYDNENMSSEWAISGTNVSSDSMFTGTGEDVAEVGQDLANEPTGIWALISSLANALGGIGDALFMVMTAPNTIGNLVAGTLQDAGVGTGIAFTIKYLIVTVFWIIIIFTIISAFLRGGKL